MVGLNSSGSGQDPMVGSCEHGNEPLGSTKGIKFDLLSDYWHLKELQLLGMIKQ
jgi:hypothetical protein